MLVASMSHLWPCWEDGGHVRRMVALQEGWRPWEEEVGRARSLVVFQQGLARGQQQPCRKHAH